MSSFHIEEHGHVAVLAMDTPENRFNPKSVRAFTDALDQVENETTATALIVTSSQEKVWSNGLDVAWLLSEMRTVGADAINPFMSQLYGLMRRILTFPMPTMACINGHAFGAGAFLAFAHDLRFMRSDRGWLCFPEADMGLALGPVFMALAKRVVPQILLEEMQYAVRRVDAATALEYHIINKTYPVDSLMQEALAYAETLTRPRDTIAKMKQETLEPTITAIDQALADLK